jgi:hypothetical protein
MVCLVLMVTACSDHSSDDAVLESRIEQVGTFLRVTNPPNAPAAWRLEPELTIGSLSLIGDPRPDTFGRITSVLSDSAGNIYVADAQALEVRVFGHDGAHLRNLGRAGAGPGEFRYLNAMAWVADTLHVLDPGNARIQRLTPDGTEVGSYAWLRLTGSPSHVRFYPASDGRLHVTALPPRTPDGQGYERGSAFWSYEGAFPTDTIFVPATDVSPLYVTCTSEMMISGWDSPLSPRFHVQPAGEGLVLTAKSTEYRLNFLNSAGDTVRQIVRSALDRPITDAAWSEVQDSVRAFQSRQPGDASCDLSTVVRPPALPVVAGLHYGAERQLIVETETETGFAFDIHDSEGRLVATVPAPARDRGVLPYFRGDRLYVATKGDLDVPGIAVYRILRAKE